MSELRDIRELMNDTDAYRDELHRRWTGLLSYRYIGRNHSSMNIGESDDTVTIRRDMRNEAGGHHGCAAGDLVAGGLSDRHGRGAQPGDRLGADRRPRL